MKVILFDIDGTLISAGGAGTRSLNLAFREMFGLDNAFDGIAMAGKTDICIIRDGLSKHKLNSENGLISQVIEAYLQNLAEEINNNRKHVKPGIREALAILGRQGQISLGLLTGNLEKGARIKLEPFELNAYFPSGAFGSDDEDRNRLLPVAIERFKELTGNEIRFADCIVIGDTPRDVYCSKPYDARCIGVATGPYSSTELTKAGADIVFENLSDTRAFLKALEQFS